MTAVISAFIVLAIRMLTAAAGWRGVVSTTPFYDPATFNFQTILTATSVAALTYGGFDGVTTLAEEVQNPRRNVMLAAVAVCLFTGPVRRPSGLPRADGLARLPELRQHRNGVPRRQPQSRRRVALSGDGGHPDRRQRGLRPGRAGGRVPIALRDGPRRLAAAAPVRPPRRADRLAVVQHRAGRRPGRRGSARRSITSARRS